jgi:hypothetical protein
MNEPTKRKLHQVCRIIYKAGIINFIFFFVIALIIGGDAISGHQETGHYYLANHGKLTEVSYFIFMYSKIHTVSLFISHPLALIAGVIYLFTGGEKFSAFK